MAIIVPSGVFGAERPFHDDFKGVSRIQPDGTKKRYPDPAKWGFTFWPGMKWKDSYGDGTNWLSNNGEGQTYCDPFRTHINGKAIPGDLRCDPFSISEQGLHIKAFKLSPEQMRIYKVGGHRRFGSGLLLSRYDFMYGKVTMTAKLPSARGSWPALWLLPQSKKWPPEIDVMEGMVWGPHKTEIHAALLSSAKEKKFPGGWEDVGVDPSEGFHEYSLDWTKDEIVIAFDGKEILRSATPPDMHQPMYVIINLAVGGKWPYNELGVKPLDSIAEERLGRGADLIQADYPAEMIVRDIRIEPYGNAGAGR